MKKSKFSEEQTAYAFRQGPIAPCCHSRASSRWSRSAQRANDA
jgi:hypothetical protein